MKPLLKINFTDFWQGFLKENNYFYNLLSTQYNVVLDEADPTILFFSCYGDDYLKFKCTRVFYTAENMRVDFSGCDYALSFDFLKRKNHFRLPLYALYIEQKKMMDSLLKPTSREEMVQMWKNKEKFCCMVVSNPAAKKRIHFFKELSKVKPVDSGGKVLNNVGGPVADKLTFIKDFKFVLAFENSKYPGYTTEKILEPLFTNSIPVYWGNPMIGLDFNPKRFLNYDDFASEEKLIEYIVKLDSDVEAAVDILQQPVFSDNKVPVCINDKNVLIFFNKVITSADTKTPVARTFKKYIHISKRTYNSSFQKFENYYRHKIKKINSGDV